MHILGSSYGISFQMYPKTTFLVSQMYTNIHSHQHNITQLTWNHLAHTCNIQTFSFGLVEACFVYHPIGDFIRKQFSRISHYILLFILPQWSSKIVGIIWELFSISTVQLHKNSIFVIGLYKYSTEIQLVYYCSTFVRFL